MIRIKRVNGDRVLVKVPVAPVFECTFEGPNGDDYYQRFALVTAATRAHARAIARTLIETGETLYTTRSVPSHEVAVMVLHGCEVHGIHALHTEDA